MFGGESFEEVFKSFGDLFSAKYLLSTISLNYNFLIYISHLVSDVTKGHCLLISAFTVFHSLCWRY